MIKQKCVHTAGFSSFHLQVVTQLAKQSTSVNTCIPICLYISMYLIKHLHVKWESQVERNFFFSEYHKCISPQTPALKKTVTVLEIFPFAFRIFDKLTMKQKLYVYTCIMLQELKATHVKFSHIKFHI